MCLKHDKASTKEFWNTEERKGKTWCWATKLYIIYNTNGQLQLLSPYQDSPTKPGWVKSNRDVKEAGKDKYDEFDSNSTTSSREVACLIHRGIHVIVEEGVICLYQEDNTELVEVQVKCYKKDFVAASTSDKKDSGEWLSWGGEAVFTKVFLPKSERDRVFKEYAN